MGGDLVGRGDGPPKIEVGHGPCIRPPGTDPDLQLGGPNHVLGVWGRNPQWGQGQSPWSEADN